MAESRKEKIALVTGASRGIGLAITRRLVQDGWSILIVARDTNRLTAAAEDLRNDAAGNTAPSADSMQFPEPRIIPFAADLSRPESPAEIIEEFEKHFDRLDLLVNNAGIVASGPIDSYSRDDWDRVMNVNARVPFFLMGATAPLLEVASGRIINIGSVVSTKGYVNQSLYAASKHALLGMTKSAARDLADRGIRVHAILPGGVATDLVRNVRPDINESELLAPEDVADAVMFLLNQKGNAVVDEIAIRRRTKEAWP